MVGPYPWQQIKLTCLPVKRLNLPKFRLNNPNNTPECFPLSYSQQRLWFLDQLEPNNPVYNICRAERIKGQLNRQALEWSLVEIVQRHAILRTSFPTVNGEPVQIVDGKARFCLPEVNLSRLHIDEKQNELKRVMRHEARTGFDLARGPMFRTKLVVLNSAEYVWLFTVHQMVWDGWSFKVFYHELASLYDSFISNKTPVLPELSLQFADYAVRQRQKHQEERLKNELSFWWQRLVHGSHYQLLPTDHPRIPRKSYRGIRRPLSLPESLTKGLKELSRRRGTTLFMTLLAAFMTLLHRYSGQGEIVVGCPFANRHTPEIESLIGPFVNTLALNTTIVENSSFTDLLSGVRSLCLAAFAHQEFPFERLVEDLQPERNLNHNPIFQTFFTFHNRAAPSLSLAGVSTESIEVSSGTAKFDLTLSLAERNRELTGFIEYSTDLFESITIERMAGHFFRLLESVVADPDCPIAILPMLSEIERHQLLIEWNDTAADYPKVFCIHQLFEVQVELTPDTVAVEFEGQRLNYDEINRRANQLAHYLVSLGVEPATLVGICVDRSLEMAVGLLGILKAGGAYVPLDPSYPPERLEFMLRDAQLSVVVTQQKFLEGGRLLGVSGSVSHPKRTTVCLDRDFEQIARQKQDNVWSPVDSSYLAYVIYTSGSTGLPKGVEVTHRSVVNALCAIRELVQPVEQDIFAAITSISFDIAALELFMPLLLGAKIVVATRECAVDGMKLSKLLAQSGATAMQATPSTWRLLLEAGWRAPKEFKILCGGEFLPRELADHLLEDGASLWNLYGPTETTIWSSIAKVESGEPPVPIGRPITNTQIYILDSHMQPVPVGVHGELYIGGDGLARGYLNRPELTAESFVVSPFSDQPGARLYRTGDLARYRADRNIEFIGRVDNQVKIRGYRVELGEIETALNQHPSVRKCVVVAVDDFPPGNVYPNNPKSLVAYIVPGLNTLSVADLRSFLKEKLPEFMLPSVFIPLDALPLTPNGKIDRKALPPPNGATSQLVNEFVAARTEIEELV
ncbi:MAG TPA: amino acid adenylation domain-containing protein, partial [Candidatus Binatia bacterium]|nr:amino acid adenylation domain-containing protein [Candidatus Binatia bacterium]